MKKRDRRVNIAVTPEEKRLFTAAAERHGLPLGPYARFCLSYTGDRKVEDCGCRIRNERISVQLTQDEYDSVKALSKEKGCSVSTLYRDALRLGL